MGEAYNEGQRQRPLPNLESADTPAPIDVIHDHITRQLQSGDPAVRNSAFARYPFLSPQYYKSVGQTKCIPQNWRHVSSRLSHNV